MARPYTLVCPVGHGEYGADRPNEPCPACEDGVFPLPQAEVWYRYYAQTPTDQGTRLRVPWGDPNRYEAPYDYLHATQAEAEELKQDLAPDEDWVICQVTIRPIAPIEKAPMRPYTLLTEPLSEEAIRLMRGTTNAYIAGVVPVALNDIIACDLESFIDIMSQRLAGSDLLMDISWEVVGQEGDTLHLKVRGDSSTAVQPVPYEPVRDDAQWRTTCPVCGDEDLLVVEAILVYNGRNTYPDSRLSESGFEVPEAFELPDGSTTEEFVKCLGTPAHRFRLSDLML